MRHRVLGGAGRPAGRPRPNKVVTEVPVDAGRCWAEQNRFSVIPAVYNTGHARTLPEFAATLPDDHTFPIDVVYTWVDDSDPRWRASRTPPARGSPASPAAACTTWRPTTRATPAVTSCGTPCAPSTSTPRGCGTSSWSPPDRCRPG
ncbi:Stealth CR1 domain-containing protein [Streptomyces thermocarboxydus]